MMHSAPRPTNELERLETLKRVDILPRPIPSSVHQILRQTSAEFEVENCILTIIGRYFQHVKAFTDINIGIVSRDNAFCSHTILQHDVMVIEDARKDIRFKENPYVVNLPWLRFYAGAPLSTTQGHNLGAVCLIDKRPMVFSSVARRRLLEIAGTISRKLGFYNDSRDLSHFDVDDLAQLIKAEADCSDKERLIKLVDAYHARLARPLPSCNP